MRRFWNLLRLRKISCSNRSQRRKMEDYLRQTQMWDVCRNLVINEFVNQVRHFEKHSACIVFAILSCIRKSSEPMNLSLHIPHFHNDMKHLSIASNRYVCDRFVVGESSSRAVCSPLIVSAVVQCCDWKTLCAAYFGYRSLSRRMQKFCTTNRVNLCTHSRSFGTSHLTHRNNSLISSIFKRFIFRFGPKTSNAYLLDHFLSL